MTIDGAVATGADSQRACRHGCWLGRLNLDPGCKNQLTRRRACWSPPPTVAGIPQHFAD
jgi:hypothetical protein